MKLIIGFLILVLLIACKSDHESLPDSLKLFEGIERAIRSEYILELEDDTLDKSSAFDENYKLALSTISREVLPGNPIRYKQLFIEKLNAINENEKKLKTRLALNAFLSRLPLGSNDAIIKDEKVESHKFGIGAVIKRIGKKFVIVDVLEGGGAFRANVLPGLQLLRIQNKNLQQMDLSSIVSKIRGRENTFVDLGFKNNLSIRVERGQIKFIPLQSSQWFLPGGRNILYLMPRTTHHEVSGRIRNLLKNQNQFEWIVLDLRKLFNGSIESCFTMANLFIAQGSSIRIKSRKGVITKFNSDAEKIYYNKIYVVYNQNSSNLAKLLVYLLQSEKNIKSLGVSSKIEIFLDTQIEIESKIMLNLVTGLVYSKDTAMHNTNIQPDINISSGFPKNPPLTAPDPSDAVQIYLSKKYNIKTN